MHATAHWFYVNEGTLAKFFGRLLLMGSVLRTSKFPVFKTKWRSSSLAPQKSNSMGSLHHVWWPRSIKAFWVYGSIFLTIPLHCTTDRQWGINTRNEHMVDNFISYQMVWLIVKMLLFIYQPIWCVSLVPDGDCTYPSSTVGSFLFKASWGH